MLINYFEMYYAQTSTNLSTAWMCIRVFVYTYMYNVYISLSKHYGHCVDVEGIGIGIDGPDETSKIYWSTDAKSKITYLYILTAKSHEESFDTF